MSKEAVMEVANELIARWLALQLGIRLFRHPKVDWDWREGQEACKLAEEYRARFEKALEEAKE